MHTYMMEIVAKEWLRERLQETENNRLIHEGRLAAAAQAAADQASLTGSRPARLALIAGRLALAVRRLARVEAAS